MSETITVTQQKPSLTGNFNEVTLCGSRTSIKKIEGLFPNTKMRHAVYIGNYPILCNNSTIQERIYSMIVTGTPILKLDAFYENKIDLIELKKFFIKDKMSLNKQLFREADRLMKLHTFSNITDLSKLDAFSNMSNKMLKKIQEKTVSTNNIKDEDIHAFTRGLTVPKVYKRIICPSTYWRVLSGRV